MSHQKLIILLLILIICNQSVLAQTDSSTASLQHISAKYFSQTGQKINKYGHRLTSKTEKTLIKLARWEKKIQAMLQKTSPETAQRLFANKEMTFSGMLEKLQQGKNVAAGATAQYNEYRDNLNVSMQFIRTQKTLLDSAVIKSAAKSAEKMQQLEEEVAESEAVVKFIRERKKQLIDESIKYIGKSKYLCKINKESYYYAETLRNYKEIFSDPEKTEEAAKKILSNIPAFKKFFSQNSSLLPQAGGAVASLAGLQTRAGVSSIIQNRLSGGGPNAQDMMKQQMQQAQAVLSNLKESLLKKGSGSTADDLPDFKPNDQRSKTLLQRLEYGANIQFVKNNSNMLPSCADVGLSLGYKLNNKSIAGLGMSYKIGMGTINRIRISHQGIGFRSFLDWKLKKEFFLSGGYELNHQSGFKKISELRDLEMWQQSGLVGITKKVPFKTKMVKNTKLQLLYDFLHRRHIPVSQPVIFRIGYVF